VEFPQDWACTVFFATSAFDTEGTLGRERALKVVLLVVGLIFWFAGLTTDEFQTLQQNCARALAGLPLIHD